MILSDTARAIRVLDERYGEKGWKVTNAAGAWDFFAVFVKCPDRHDRWTADAHTARDAILRAAERVQATGAGREPSTGASRVSDAEQDGGLAHALAHEAAGEIAVRTDEAHHRCPECGAWLTEHPQPDETA